MTSGELVDLVEVLPAIRGIVMKTTLKRTALTRHAARIADEVATRYDWDFVCDAADATSVADQADYTLTGNSNDCRDIINIRFKDADSDHFVLLDKYRPVDMDEKLSGVDSSDSGVAAWTIKERNPNGFPVITLVGTPGTSGDTIRYRYRKRNISTSDFPDEFAAVLQYALITKLVPSYAALAERKLQFMVDRYAAPGGDVNPAKLDAQLKLRNRERAGLHGW